MQKVLDRLDLVIDALTLGQYGLEVDWDFPSKPIDWETKGWFPKDA